MIIPSIDLMDGKAVQLRQGREKVLEVEKPINLAREFDKYGEIGVVDLNRAIGNGENLEIVNEICKIAECRVGGGIRSIKEAKELISYGAKKVIIGTKAFENDTLNYNFLKKLRNAIGKQRIIIAVDVVNQKILTHGWHHSTGISVFNAVTKLWEYCSEFLCTCVEREGNMEGTDIRTLEKLSNVSKNRITAAGGISSIKEVVKLSEIGIKAQIGMALYTRKIKLDEAFIACLNWKNSLIPTVVQDEYGQVLTLAYSSKDSLRETFSSGKMCYFSRARNKLWMKGETSGNVQEFVRVRKDCDSDALLFTVKQKGVACHTGNYSCFGDKKFTLQNLYEVVKDRIKHPKASSYTSKLSLETLKGKILEEAKEVIEAKSGKDIIWEVADTLYFLTVLLAKKHIKFDDVIYELRRRGWK